MRILLVSFLLLTACSQGNNPDTYCEQPYDMSIHGYVEGREMELVTNGKEFYRVYTGRKCKMIGRD